VIADMIKNKLDHNDLFYKIEKYKEDPILSWFSFELKKEFENH
jgi:hypothetical protein